MTRTLGVLFSGLLIMSGGPLAAEDVPLRGGHCRPWPSELEKARAYATEWLEDCAVDPGAARRSGAPEGAFAAEIASAVRRALLERDGGGEWKVARYEALWALEFRSLPASEHDALRTRIRADLARVNDMGLDGSVASWTTRRAGYRLLGDLKEDAVALREMAVRFPCEPASLRAQIEQWEKEHPAPDLQAESDARSEHQAARHRFETGLAQACPASRVVAPLRARSAQPVLSLSDKEIEGVIDDYLAALAKDGPAVPAALADAAVQIALDRRVRLDRLDGLMRARPEMRSVTLSEDASERQRAAVASRRWRQEADTAWLQARVDHRLGRKAERDAAARELEEKVRSAASNDRSRGDALVAWLRAEIAESEDRKADAAALYRAALRGFLFDDAMTAAGRGALRRVGADDAETAGRTGLRITRVSRPSTVDRWRAIERPLPEGTLGLLSGPSWSAADLKGRRTLINVWATWCGPCVKELPELQKLYDRVKQRSDVAIVTFNIDEEVGLVAPFLSAHAYTFPVALARDYWQQGQAEISIPLTWIVDDKGVARFEMRGFGSSDQWLESTLAKLEGGLTSTSN